MTSPPQFSFSKPAMSGDAVSVLVLVEDSSAMAPKWPAVRDSYLPNLFENLRSTDPSVQMEARWLTTSSPASVVPPAVPIMDLAQAQLTHDLSLGQNGSAKLSPGTISNAITILSSATGRQSTTRHLVLVAATGPLTAGALNLNDATPSGFDSWDEIAMVLKQQYIRLHVILSIGAEMRTYHELFKRSLQLQNNSEVPPWFQVDSRRYSIRLSGRPQYVRGSAALPVPLVPTAISEDSYNNPSPPASSPPPVSPPTSVSSPSSPSHTASPNVARKSITTSPNTPRSRPRASESPQSPPGPEGGGLVSYLQQMHGLTKKKSYGIKAPKKTYADIRLPNAGRPILPRLEVPPSQSDIYTYPSFDNLNGSEMQTPTSDPQFPPPRRHSVDQLPSASLVARTINEDRRARRHSPWLPMAPYVSSTPSSPTSTTSPGTRAALQSLAAMTPRLPDFGTTPKDRTPFNAPGAMEPRRSYTMASDPMSGSQHNAGYYACSTTWPHQASAAASPAASAPSPTHTLSSTLPPTPQLVSSEYSYGSSPPSSTATTPASLSAPMGENENGEDQPFVVPPEYEAQVNASFQESLRTGEMQANMTLRAPATTASTLANQTFAQTHPADQQYFDSSHTHAQHVMSHQDTGYPVYYSSAYSNGEYTVVGAQEGGEWQYHVGDTYMATQAEYASAQGQQWYSS